jgi:hypothetical protein
MAVLIHHLRGRNLRGWRFEKKSRQAVIRTPPAETGDFDKVTTRRFTDRPGSPS